MEDLEFLYQIINWCHCELEAVDTQWLYEGWCSDNGLTTDISNLLDAAWKVKEHYERS